VNSTVTAHQLYPASRIAGMTTRQLLAVHNFADYDTVEPTSIYSGMDRAETIATAQRTIADVSAALRARVAE